MFQFKSFSIHQDRSAMKVTEVACIFAAWLPLSPAGKRLLDIGSGTGLLSLMLAQRFSQLAIDAVELDKESFIQGMENINASPFANRIRCVQADIRALLDEKGYDMIVCNPPFFENQLRSPRDQKNIAWHGDQLRIQELFTKVDELLQAKGQFAFLLPMARYEEIKVLCVEHGFHIFHELHIQHTAQHKPGFFVMLVSKEAQADDRKPLHSTLSIRNENGYTEDMKTLMQDFYLRC